MNAARSGPRDPVTVGLLVGVEDQPRPEDLELLISEGQIPAEGVRLVALTVAVDEASRRDALREYYRAACVQQGRIEGTALADELRFADVVVHGRRIVVVLPKAADAPTPEAPSPEAPSTGAPDHPEAARDPAVARIERQLSEAGPATLQGCDRILAVVVMHERPVPIAEVADPGAATATLTPQRVARGFVDGYKRPGWVPSDLVVDDATAITILQRPDTGQLSTRAANAILAGALGASLVGLELVTCAAISFAGENDVFGHTRLAILAASTDRHPTAVGG
jgi:hypothetical protein